MTNTGTRTDRSLGAFIALVFFLSLPLWLVGGGKLPLPVNLPVSALTAFVPAGAAAILIYRRGGASWLAAFLHRAFDFRSIRARRWYLPALLLAPLIYLVSYILMRLLRLPLPSQVDLPLQAAPALLLGFSASAIGEELGWTGYATDPAQGRWGMLRSGLILGGVWAVWHGIPFVQTGNTLGWVLAQSLKTVAMRVVLVWLYNRSGKSVFSTVLFHTTDNLAWALFPNAGSHYNPLITGLVMAVAAGLMLRRGGSSRAMPPAPDTASPERAPRRRVAQPRPFRAR